jgi:maleate cis-trans isomerase
MNEHLEEAARLLAKAPVDVVAFACTSGSFTEGIAYDREIQHRIESATGGLRVLTAAASALEALREMSAQKVSVVAPYPPQVNEQLLAFLSEAGFDVVAFESCNPHAAVIDSISPSAISEVVMNIANRARPDAIFVSCTALSTATVIDKLESATGKAVITSNQALFWQCMRALDHSKPIFGGGALLRNKIPVGASR